MTTYRMTLRTSLRIAAPELWDAVSSMDGVNRELWPVVMSAPRGARIDHQTPLGTVAFRSLLSIAYVLPIDLHWLRLMKVEPGQGFEESSWSLSEKRWEHRRRLSPTASGCDVEDEVVFEPRFAAPAIKAVVSRIFRRRHAYLANQYGADHSTRFQIERMP